MKLVSRKEFLINISLSKFVKGSLLGLGQAFNLGGGTLPSLKRTALRTLQPFNPLVDHFL